MNIAISSNDTRPAEPTFAGAVSVRDPVSDEALVGTAKIGDEEAFETLVKRHRPRLFAIALRYMRIREDAEDVVQQTFQKTFVHLNNFAGKSSFSTWLTRIAINEALMCLRRARGRREIPIDDFHGEEGTPPQCNVPDASPDPEATYMQREDARILSIAMRGLNPRMRRALELKELRELSARETARQMGLSISAVKARVFNGRKKLESTLRSLERSAVPRQANRTRPTLLSQAQ